MDTPGPTSTGWTGAGALLLLPAFVVSVLGGCYRYSSADPGSVAAGDQVVLTLAGEASGAAAADSSRQDRHTVEGRVVEIGEGTIALRTSRPAADPFRSGATVVDTVSFGAEQVRSVRRKELETAKTAALGAGVALGVGLGSVLLFESVGGGGTGSGNGGDGINRVFLRFP